MDKQQSPVAPTMKIFEVCTYEELTQKLDQLEVDKDFWTVESTTKDGQLEDGSQKIAVFFKGFKKYENKDVEAYKAIKDCAVAEKAVKQAINDLGDTCNALIVCNIEDKKNFDMRIKRQKAHGEILSRDMDPANLFKYTSEFKLDPSKKMGIFVMRVPTLLKIRRRAKDVWLRSRHVEHLDRLEQMYVAHIKSFLLIDCQDIYSLRSA